MSNSEEKKLWGGRFENTSSSITEELSASIHFDHRLYKQDIRGSKAHARMLNKIGILIEDELQAILDGLDQIEQEIESGTFPFSKSLEDIHMNIESRLTDLIGDAGRKLHTARSRNDQIATDVRMYVVDESMKIDDFLHQLISVLVDKAKIYIDVIFPGYTHLQVAQPILFSHHLLAYTWKLLRDRNRLRRVVDSSRHLPLGVGAFSGVNYANDRAFLKEELDFNTIMLNSMDAVSDRDFILEFLFFASVLGTHLSNFCEDIIIWSSSEFNYIRLADHVTTGSSIMPQKRNPDLAELIRGKSGRLTGNLMSLFTILKGLPMTYNRDLQEDKEPLFDSIDTTILSLQGMIEMIDSMEIHTHKMREAVYSNYSTATDMADYLAKKNVPFREAHEIIGSLVKYCEQENLDFFTLPLSILQKFSSHFDETIIDIIKPENSPERRESIGSTKKSNVLYQIAVLEGILEKE